MHKYDLREILSIIVIGVLTRIPFLEKFQSHWDGPQYSIALESFNLSQHTPAPPGYPVYIGLGKIINTFVSNPHLSMLIVSSVGCAVGASLLYILGKKIISREFGFICALLYLSGPTFYYFSITANPYGIIPIFTVLFAYSVYLITNKKGNGYFLGICYSIAVGFRPQDALFLTPLFFFGFLLLDKKNKVISVVVALLGSMFWLFPTVYGAGGINPYITAMKSSYQSGAVPGISENVMRNIEPMLKGLYLSFGISTVFLLSYLRRDYVNFTRFIKDWKMYVFFAVWIVPSFLFNLLVRSDHAAHQMTYLAGLLIFVAYAITKVKTHSLRQISLICIVAVNLLIFFKDRDPAIVYPYTPQSFHYSELLKNNNEMSYKVQYIKRMYDPDSTVIVTTAQRWRPVMYHLKNYRVASYGALESEEPGFNSVIREGRMWKSREYSSDESIINIPSTNDTVIFFDNEAKYYVIDEKHRTLTISKNYSLTVVPVSPGLYRFGYKRLEKI